MENSWNFHGTKNQETKQKAERKRYIKAKMKSINEIEDREIIDLFILGAKNPKEKILHGVSRRDGKISVMFERESSMGYTGFLEKETLNLSAEDLDPIQIKYLEDKGYSI